MSYEMKPDTGTLFKNDRKEKETHPDYQGECFVGGQVYRMSAWLKVGKKGKYMSFSFRGKEQNRQQKPAPAARGKVDELDDDIPF